MELLLLSTEKVRENQVERHLSFCLLDRDVQLLIGVLLF